MEAEEILENLKKHKRQAKQLYANSIVVPFERAESAIRKAFQEGFDKGKEYGTGNMEENP